MKKICVLFPGMGYTNLKPLLYYSFSAAPNMDYYFKQNGQQIKELDSAGLSNLENGILFFKERRIKRDSTLRQRLEGKKYTRLGDNICYAEFSAEKDNPEDNKEEQ